MRILLPTTTRYHTTVGRSLKEEEEEDPLNVGSEREGKRRWMMMKRKETRGAGVHCDVTNCGMKEEERERVAHVITLRPRVTNLPPVWGRKKKT